MKIEDTMYYEIRVNEHKLYYQNINEYIKSDTNQEDWISEDERMKSIKNDTICELIVFPKTPIISYSIVASSPFSCITFFENELNI